MKKMKEKRKTLMINTICLMLELEYIELVAKLNIVTTFARELFQERLRDRY